MQNIYYDTNWMNLLERTRKVDIPKPFYVYEKEITNLNRTWRFDRESIFFPIQMQNRRVVYGI